MRLLLCLLLMLGFISTHAQKLILRAGRHDRKDVPVSHASSFTPQKNKQYFFVNQKTAHSIPVQFEGRIMSFILDENIPAGDSATYLLRESRQRGVKKTKVVAEDSSIIIQAAGKAVLKYHTGIVYPRAGLPDYYKRSGFIHPVYSPGGKILTDDFPKGHEHQHGVFQTWVNTTFRGDKVDFWNQHGLTGTVEHSAILSSTSGVAYTKVKMLLSHRSLKNGIILKDTVTLTIYPFDKYFLFDIESHQVNVTQDTLHLNQYHYGGMAFRGNKAWNPDDTVNFEQNWQLVTAEGKRSASANHTRAGWVKITGNVEQASVAATVFDHPLNFRYPQFVRVHPSMPYFCFFPMVEQAHYIEPGGHYRSRYRYLIEDGEGDYNLLERVKNDWVEGIVVEEVR